jgi:DNA segregation ATPase FtsK/SpoIIIE-like protein
MGLEEIIDKFNNEVEPRLDEIKEYFKENLGIPTVSIIQRRFKMGYSRACRTLKQLEDID